MEMKYAQKITRVKENRRPIILSYIESSPHDLWMTVLF